MGNDGGSFPSKFSFLSLAPLNLLYANINYLSCYQLVYYLISLLCFHFESSSFLFLFPCN